MNMTHDYLNQEFLMRSVTAFRAALIGPDPDGDDRDAPILNDYLTVLQGRRMKLHGWASGHPRLGAAFVTTSQLIHVTPDRRWARTLSRWYRLGRPQRLDTSQLSPDIELAGYCVPMTPDGFSIPLHLARRLMEQGPTGLSRSAMEKGLIELSESLSAIAESWPPQRR
ncbi:DUF6634 family protein [Pseudooceanicola algae]|nr:DUF6634 family protein [Pseudooceanicola algae]